MAPAAAYARDGIRPQTSGATGADAVPAPGATPAPEADTGPVPAPVAAGTAQAAMPRANAAAVATGNGDGAHASVGTGFFTPPDTPAERPPLEDAGAANAAITAAAAAAPGAAVEVRTGAAVVEPVRTLLREMPVTANGNRHEVTLTLTPGNLGELRVRIVAAPDGGVRATILATTPEAKAALEAARPQLGHTLSERGLRLDGFTVALAAPAAAAPAGDRSGGDNPPPNGDPRPSAAPDSFANGGDGGSSASQGRWQNGGGNGGAFAPRFYASRDHGIAAPGSGPAPRGATGRAGSTCSPDGAADITTNRRDPRKDNRTMNPVAPGRSGNATAGTQVQRATGGMGKSDFLNLLTQQLRYQDPLNPMEDRDMMSQLAQFSALEETQAMRSAIDALAAANQMSQAASFLGKKVTGKLAPGYDPYGNPTPAREVAGVVSGVTFQNGNVLLKVGNDTLPLAGVGRVETAG
jgi:flagellar basal-body rod modification protein FlgD